MTDIVIAGAARTPVGAFNGGLASLPAHKLGEVAISEALRRAAVDPKEVSEVIMGQILQAGEGQNPARQAAVAAGIPFERTAYGVNQLCGSGLRTVALGYQAIRAGDSDIVVAGGQESMSQAPHCIHLRDGVKMGDAKMIDTMIRDGLWDAFNGYHMGNTAENVATRWQITREQQDEFAAWSQAKAEAAQKSGRFKDEIVPVVIQTRRGETVVDTDEHPKHGTTVEVLAKLRPAFDKNGSVTAGNASGINDGGAAVVLMTAEAAQRRGLKPLAPHRVVGDGRGRSGDHGHGADPGVAHGARKSRLVGRRSRPDRGQRSLCGAGLCGRQGSRLRARQAQRQRRRDRVGPPDRRLGMPGAGDAALRDAEARREKGSGDAVHRRRHGDRDVRGARLARSSIRTVGRVERRETRLFPAAAGFTRPT